METTLKGPKIYHSEIKRAEDFVKTIQEAARSRKEYKTKMRLELGQVFSTQFAEKWIEIRAKKGVDATLRWFLDYDKERPDPETFSPYEIASRFAKHVLTHTKMPERYYSDSKVDIINGTHATVIEPFISFTLKDQIEKDPVNPKGETPTEKMGGLFRTGESFEIDTAIDEQGKKNLKVKLRGKEYNLPQSKLEELASYCK